TPRCTRRTVLALGLLPLAAALTARVAHAMGRTPMTGRLAMDLPWPTASIDPHDLRDPTAALFAGAIADSMYGLDPSAGPYPTLAAALPSRESGGTIVRLREGLRTARGTPLFAGDLVASVERARARGASALLVDVPKPTTVQGDPLAASFGAIEPARLARV